MSFWVGVPLVNFDYFHGYGPLHSGAKYGCLEMMHLLISCGSNIEALDRYFNTPLHIAIKSYPSSPNRSSQYWLIKALVLAGANVNAYNIFGDSALHMNRSRRVLKLLLRAGADVNARNASGNTPLHCMAMEPRAFEVAKLMIEAGSDVNAQNAYGFTVLHFAARDCFAKMVKLLLESGAKVEIASGNEELDPLCASLNDWSCYNFRHFASDRRIRRAVRCVRLMVEHGADVNQKTKEGMTPLGICLTASHLHTDVIRELLYLGARVHFKQPDFIQMYYKSSRDSEIPLLLLRQAALQHPASIELKLLDEDSRRLYAECRQEVERMRKRCLHGSSASSVLDLLLAKPSICACARDPWLSRLFAADSLKESFPIYHDLLRARYVEMCKKLELMNRAVGALRSILPWSELSLPHVYDNVLWHLSRRDLKALQEV